uniref:S-adenosyl-L-methionine-dependent tRNA 4-demethylwyosine synthase TYW1-like isoform X3 n=1 Tax=Myxine glutinosa TaxID=7769 RepID=UPI00358E8944
MADEAWMVMGMLEYVAGVWHVRLYIYSAVAFGCGIWAALHYSKTRRKSAPAQVDTCSCCSSKRRINKTGKKDVVPLGLPPVKIFFASETGTAKKFAENLSQEVESLGYQSTVLHLKNYDPEDGLLEEARNGSLCAFVLPTYTEGNPPDAAAWFCKWLSEAANDFRYEKTHLSGLRYIVLGLGNSFYEEHYNKVARNVDKWLWHLGARRLMPRGETDKNSAQSRHGSAEADFAAWLQQGSYEYETTSEEDEGDTDGDLESLVDVEDLGIIMKDMQNSKDVKGNVLSPRKMLNTSKRMEADAVKAKELREMITPALSQSLTKQGYRLVGSHSAVKLCRWTKSMLRGRGGCYKHTFYGIESHRCMEATPSLACANKCVFCWRHHTNPVGTEWRWKQDDPESIVQGALQNHYDMIRQFKGVPGVQNARYEEAFTVRHCALSLVGEPIMYPEINTLVRLLHSHRISSFLVTNAQFPAEIRNLEPVTQLYVSVDASSERSLKRIDRPLFKDFWSRFLGSLQALSEKGQRTVYRLTLVKAWNVDEIQAYAELVTLGRPDFIEVKGVTYCGEGGANSLTMANVPWHEEVVAFVTHLADLIPNYEIVCEHAHSNCLLLAHTRFKRDGVWWTWIDYDRFHELYQEHKSSGGSRTFSAEDYAAPTPAWALFGSNEQGFDPVETRHLRHGKPKDISGC